MQMLREKVIYHTGDRLFCTKNRNTRPVKMTIEKQRSRYFLKFLLKLFFPLLRMNVMMKEI